MAVLEYKEGDHPGGFVGFRAVRTVGCDNDYRQLYFSLKEYSYTRAKALAEQFENEWAKEAADVLREKRLNGQMLRSQNTIATGLRGYINAEKRTRAGQSRRWYTPVFLVRAEKGRDKVFNIYTLGYQAAWEQAVDAYADYYELPDLDKLRLLAKRPPKTFFTETLYSGLSKRGHHIPQSVIEEKMQTDERQNDKG